MQVATRYQYEGKVPHAETDYDRKGNKHFRNECARAVFRDLYGEKLKEINADEDSRDTVHIEGQSI